jgi:hypothetical protein
MAFFAVALGFTDDICKLEAYNESMVKTLRSNGLLLRFSWNVTSHRGRNLLSKTMKRAMMFPTTEARSSVPWTSGMHLVMVSFQS